MLEKRRRQKDERKIVTHYLSSIYSKDVFSLDPRRPVLEIEKNGGNWGNPKINKMSKWWELGESEK